MDAEDQTPIQKTPTSIKEITDAPAPDTAKNNTPKQPVTPQSYVGGEPRYKITKLSLAYAHDHPALPAIDEIASRISVKLALTDTGYVAVGEGAVPVQIPLASIDEGLPHLQQFWFHASAIRKIAEAVVSELNAHGLVGIYIAPDPDQIDEGRDIRPDQDRSLRLIIQTVVVTETRTLASGGDIPSNERINHPRHQRIKDRSPGAAGCRDEW